MSTKKRKKRIEKRNVLYIPLDDIKAIDKEFLDEMETVKTRLRAVGDAEIIKAFHATLLAVYNGVLEIKNYECEVDYDIKLAKIEARASERKPWRRCWLWRLLFRPTTNRAQDIIEERAELEADIDHTAEEKKLAGERKEFVEANKPLTKRELKRMLKEAIRKADSTETNKGFEEPGEPGTDKPDIEDVEQLLRESAAKIELKPYDERRKMTRGEKKSRKE